MMIAQVEDDRLCHLVVRHELTDGSHFLVAAQEGREADVGDARRNLFRCLDQRRRARRRTGVAAPGSLLLWPSDQDAQVPVLLNCLEVISQSLGKLLTRTVILPAGSGVGANHGGGRVALLGIDEIVGEFRCEFLGYSAAFSLIEWFERARRKWMHAGDGWRRSRNCSLSLGK